MPEARGGGQEELPHAQGQGRWLGGANPHPRPGAEARRSFPTPEVKIGWEELPHARSQGLPGGATSRSRLGRQLRGAPPRPRPGAAAGRSYPMPEVRGGGREELTHTRGQGLRLRRANPCLRPGAVARGS